MEGYSILIIIGFIGVVILFASAFAYGLIDILDEHGKINYKHIDMTTTEEEINGAVQLSSLGISVVTVLILITAITFYDTILMNPSAPPRLALLLEGGVLITWVAVIVSVPMLHYKKITKG